VGSVFLIAAVLIVGVCLIAGFVPDPLVMMGKVRRDREPRRYYFYLAMYLFLGAALSTGSWLAGDRAKDATTVHAQKSE
jgi:hypothetical protein